MIECNIKRLNKYIAFKTYLSARLGTNGCTPSGSPGKYMIRSWCGWCDITMDFLAGRKEHPAVFYLFIHSRDWVSEPEI